jgi:hypothetical protein
MVKSVSETVREGDEKNYFFFLKKNLNSEKKRGQYFNQACKVPNMHKTAMIAMGRFAAAVH